LLDGTRRAAERRNSNGRGAAQVDSVEVSPAQPSPSPTPPPSVRAPSVAAPAEDDSGDDEEVGGAPALAGIRCSREGLLRARRVWGHLAALRNHLPIAVKLQPERWPAPTVRVDRIANREVPKTAEPREYEIAESRILGTARTEKCFKTVNM
jgi:hypothetical protein